MVDKFGNLFKNEESDRTIKPAAASKKLGESKRRLNGICRSLMIDSSVYEPKRTVGSVETYLATTEKVDRMLYSVISGFIIGLDEKARGTFSTNVEIKVFKKNISLFWEFLLQLCWHLLGHLRFQLLS